MLIWKLLPLSISSKNLGVKFDDSFPLIFIYPLKNAEEKRYSTEKTSSLDIGLAEGEGRERKREGRREVEEKQVLHIKCCNELLLVVVYHSM